MGLLDRGVIAPGYKADINLIDFARLRLGAPYPVRDLPAGGLRMSQDCEGMSLTKLSGEITYRDGKPTKSLPGRLIRGMQTAPADLCAGRNCRGMTAQKLAGHSIVVTGGGSGIGAACALLAAQEGARVTICGRTVSKLENTAGRIRAAGGEVLVVPTDVTVEVDIIRLMREALRIRRRAQRRCRQCRGRRCAGTLSRAGRGRVPPGSAAQRDQYHAVHQTCGDAPSPFWQRLVCRHVVPRRASHPSIFRRLSRRQGSKSRR